MCFGNQTQKTVDTTSTANPAVASAATANLATAQNTLNNSSIGQQYQGPLTAAIAPNQQGTIDAATGIANNGTGDASKALINSYASAPAQSVSTGTIAQNMSPYMNQYVMQALAPQMRQMDMTDAAQNAANNAQATSSGAFGDARAGIQQANTNFNQNVEREGVIGNAYNQAFNTAIGAGAQDVANQNATQQANAGYNETALGRALGGAQALQGLQTQQLGAQTTANSLTQQDTAQKQADLTAQYNNWLQAQQSQLQGQQSANSTVLAGATAMPASKSEVTSAPDNSGFAMLGSIGGALLSDRRAKAAIKKVGELDDGQNVYRYHYKDDPDKTVHLGLMAQEVKKHRPDAVVKRPDGYLSVDYGKATALARSLGA